jgi:hypothetical protein
MLDAYAWALSHRIETSRIGVFLQNLKNEVPITQSVHLIGISVVVASSAMIDLRLLGLMNRTEPARELVARFMPALWGALGCVALSGMVMIMTEPSRSLPAAEFQRKMLALCAAIGVNLLLQRLVPKHQNDWQPRAVPRALAAASLGLWAFIIVEGRWIAYR